MKGQRLERVPPSVVRLRNIALRWLWLRSRYNRGRKVERDADCIRGVETVNIQTWRVRGCLQLRKAPDPRSRRRGLQRLERVPWTGRRSVVTPLLSAQREGKRGRELR